MNKLPNALVIERVSNNMWHFRLGHMDNLVVKQLVSKSLISLFGKEVTHFTP